MRVLYNFLEDPLKGPPQLAVWKAKAIAFTKTFSSCPFVISSSDERYHDMRSILINFIQTQLVSRAEERFAQRNSKYDRCLATRIKLFYAILSHFDKPQDIYETAVLVEPQWLEIMLKHIMCLKGTESSGRASVLKLLSDLLESQYFEELITSNNLDNAFTLLYFIILRQQASTRALTSLTRALLKMTHFDNGLRTKLIFLVKYASPSEHRQTTLERLLRKVLLEHSVSSPSRAFSSSPSNDKHHDGRQPASAGLCCQCISHFNRELVGKYQLTAVDPNVEPERHNTLQLHYQLMQTKWLLEVQDKSCVASRAAVSSPGKLQVQLLSDSATLESGSLEKSPSPTPSKTHFCSSTEYEQPSVAAVPVTSLSNDDLDDAIAEPRCHAPRKARGGKRLSYGLPPYETPSVKLPHIS